MTKIVKYSIDHDRDVSLTINSVTIFMLYYYKNVICCVMSINF